MLLEQGAYRTERIGESLSPGALPLLQYLGVKESFEAAGFTPVHGFTAAWGDERVLARDFLFTGRGHGWNLDRRRFDWGLAHAAAAAGARLLMDTPLRHFDRDGADWRLVTGEAAEGDAAAIRARFVIDATGRKAQLGTALGARIQSFDRLVAVAAYLPAAPGPVEGTVLVETVPEGWWYSAPLPDGRLSVCLMSDADIVHRGELADAERWWRALAATHHTGRRCGRIPPADIGVWPARSQRLEPPCGPGWTAAGDAAAAFDPLSAMGIGYALSSGIAAAARAAAAAAGQPDDTSYQDDISHHVAAFRTHQIGYYAAERRFAASPFWSVRHNAETRPSS